MIKIFYSEYTGRLRIFQESNKHKTICYGVDIKIIDEEFCLKRVDEKEIVIFKLKKKEIEAGWKLLKAIFRFIELKPYEILFSFYEIKEKLIYINNILKKYLDDDIKEKLDIRCEICKETKGVSILKDIFKELGTAYPEIFE